MEMMAKTVPVRTPICRTSEICASMAGSRETKAPLPKPKRAANTMIGAFPVAGNQSARIRTPIHQLDGCLYSGISITHR